MRIITSLLALFIASCAVIAAQQTVQDAAVSFSVYSLLPDGSIHRLSPGGGFFVNASIRPQGDAAVFWGAVTGLPRIWHADIEGRMTIPITPAGRGAVEPSFDWQGTRIVFASERGEDRARLDIADIRDSWRTGTFEERGYAANLNLFVMKPDGSAVRQITRGAFHDVRPAFSPDGNTVAFLSNRWGVAQHVLYLVAADGSSDPKPLVTDVWAGRPWFSVDGRWVYFFTAVHGHERICRVPAAGGKWEPITPEDVPRQHGTFLDPDGKHLWFHSSGEIYQYELATGELVNLNPPGFEHHAAHVTRARNGAMTFDSTR